MLQIMNLTTGQQEVTGLGDYLGVYTVLQWVFQLVIQ